MVRAASVQFNHKPGDIHFNLQRIEEFCIKAAEDGVKLIVFPEMCITGYWHLRKLGKEELLKLSEFIPYGPSTQFLSRLARDYRLIIGAGLIERTPDDVLYNSYVVCDVDGSIHCHRKIHCFISEYMESGNEYTVFETSLGHKVGILTCYDNNIIENVRVPALKGADILLAPHQTGGVGSLNVHTMGLVNPEFWERRLENPQRIEKEFKGPKGRGWLMRWLPSRAHDNGMFLIFSNGVGIDDDEVRTGNAMILDCYGRILAETWKADDDVVTADLDMDLLPTCTGRRWMRGRKPYIYTDITRTSGNELDPRAARFSG